jgi:single-strand DNA-binding protein
MMNRVILLGNLTTDPELRYSPSGTAIASFNLAMNRKWKDANGVEKEEVCFVPITFFAGAAETISQYVKKGNQFLIEGRLRQENWEDKNTGQKRSKLTVVGETFSFVGGGKKKEEGEPDESEREREAETPRQRGKPQGKGQGKGKPKEEEPASDEQPPEDEDIPFLRILDPRYWFRFLWA